MSNIDNIVEKANSMGGEAKAIDTSKTWICDDNTPVDEDLVYYMIVEDDVLKISVYGIETGIEYSNGIDETDYNILIGSNDVPDFRWNEEE